MNEPQPNPVAQMLSDNSGGVFPMRLRLAFLIFLSVFSRLTAEKIGWHPELVLELGRGTDLRNQDAIKPVVAVMSATPSDNPVTGDATINVRYVQHEFDLAKSFSLNASLSAKNKMYQGKVGFALADSFRSTGNTVTFVFECNRNFGDKLYSTSGLAPNFVAAVNELKQVLSGTTLHKAVTDRFGTHFVSGQQKTAKVVLIYTLTYESQSTARSRALDFGLKYRDGISSVDFQTAIKDEMSRSDSRVSLNYQFYSSDPLVLPDFPLTARISTFDEFLTYAAKVETYCKAMNPANAKDIAYIVEPLQNLPGYLQLLGGFRPGEFFNSSYDRFLATYAEFKGWEEQLFQWSGDARRMSWLNADGQKVVLGMRADVSRALQQLEEMAKAHFRDGKPLVVTEEIINYRVNFNRIPIPSINNIIHNENVGPGWDLLIGFVNCGPKELVKETPFAQLYVLDQQGLDVRSGLELSSDPALFEAGIRSFVAGWPVFSGAEGLFAQPVWRSIKDAALKNRILFYTYWPPIDAPLRSRKWSLALKDATGAPAFVINALFMNADLGVTSLEASPSTEVSISKLSTYSEVALLGNAVPLAFGVTNSGPGAAFGVSLSWPVPTGFEASDIGGSQGAGSVTNGTLTYHVGSMAHGASAEVHLSLIPQRTGQMELPAPLTLGIGDGLTDPNLTDNRLSFSGLEVVEPRLAIGSNAGLVELRWQSASGRLAVEESTALDSANWSLPSEVASTDGDTSTLKISPATGQRFYRLRVQ